MFVNQKVSYGKSVLWNDDKITEINIFYLKWTFLFSIILSYYYHNKHAYLCRQTNEIQHSWVQVVLLPTLPSNWKSWNNNICPKIW